MHLMEILPSNHERIIFYNKNLGESNTNNVTNLCDFILKK